MSTFALDLKQRDVRWAFTGRRASTRVDIKINAHEDNLQSLAYLSGLNN